MVDSLLKERMARGGAYAQMTPGMPASPKTHAAPAARSTAALADRVRQQLLQTLDPKLLREKVDPKAAEQIRRQINHILDREAEDLTWTQKAALATEIANDLFGYGPIQELLDDPEVTEVMVNRWNDVWFEKNGRLEKSSVVFRDDEHVRTVIQKIVGPIGRRVDESSPMVDARLPDGSRVNAVIPPLAIDGACITVRKFGRRLTAEDLLRLGTLGESDLRFLEACVRGRVNILISGGTGSGKTTLLNVLSGFIPAGERIVTIEDSAELQLQQPHVVRLEARPPNMEGKGEVPIRALVRNALRMRPDRIVVGEVRGGEALDMLQAMNTGHEGSMTTLHANSAKDALSRLETMVLMAGEDLPLRAIREQIAAAVDLIVQVSRLRDGSRRVVSMVEVGGIDADGTVIVEDVAVFRETGVTGDKVEGRLEMRGVRPGFVEKLRWRGVVLDEGLFAKAGGGADG